MKTAGIIAEYNPFHKGHEYQIRYTKERLKADYVIVAMSGDYVQRGTPALISKHARAEMALRCGADLVLEMPVSVSTASAEAFAMGGVSLLDGLGVVDMLCFGSESGEISALKELAEIFVEVPAGACGNSCKGTRRIPAITERISGKRTVLSCCQKPGTDRIF